MRRDGDKTYRRLITSARWRALRASWLEAHPLCDDCKKRGRVRAACEVHHILPIERGRTDAEKERRAFDPGNLRALCRECHKWEHVVMRTWAGNGGSLMSGAMRAKKVEAAKRKLFGGGGGGASDPGGALFSEGEGAK